jgi:catechol 2,3-dioxygenase-like lactoylglutathione lyase family enzyme
MLKTDHIVFPVWDAKACLAFWRGVMGFALIETHEGADWGGWPWLMMILSPGDGREVVLVHLKGAKRPPRDKLARDIRHMAFAETSVARLDAWRRKFAKAEIAFWEETHGVRSSLYCADPDGNTIEITAPPSRATKRPSRAALAKAERWMAAP